MKYARAMLRDVEGYVPGEQPQGSDVIKLNTNENPYPPSPKVLEALRALGPGALRKYPDPVSVGLRRACAERYGYDGPEWIIAGNGMDELLAMALRTFVDPGDTVMTTYPTYTLYETLAQLHDVRIKQVDLDDQFQLPEAFLDHLEREVVTSLLVEDPPKPLDVGRAELPIARRGPPWIDVTLAFEEADLRDRHVRELLPELREHLAVRAVVSHRLSRPCRR